MKKILLLLSAVVLAALLIIFVPIPKVSYDDGGTREYESLSYKIVRWNRLTDDSIYSQTRVYWGADKNRTIDELWQEESQFVKHAFDAIIFDLTKDTVFVQAMPYEAEHGKILSFSSATVGTDDVDYGSFVRVGYVGTIPNSSPAQIEVYDWLIEPDRSDTPFQGEWLNKEKAIPCDDVSFCEPTVTAVYADCFFIRTYDDYIAKINGVLSSTWWIGDQINLICENVYYNETQRRMEADLVTIGDNSPETDYTVAKPVIYLYPETETDVEVTLTLDGELTCTYPAYKDGWHVTAAPDGTLTDERGKTYNYLYWEGETNAAFDMSRGFCVKGDDTAAFLETALTALGLNRREANEFIVYWLPLMEQNPYNLIAFQTDVYTDAAKLDISPAPDTLIRVFMAFKGVDAFVDIEPQTLSAPARVGFTAVEWGGTEIE